MPDASLAPACSGTALVQHAKAACAAARSPPNMILADDGGAAGLPLLACSLQMRPWQCNSQTYQQRHFSAIYPASPQARVRLKRCASRALSTCLSSGSRPPKAVPGSASPPMFQTNDQKAAALQLKCGCCCVAYDTSKTDTPETAQQKPLHIHWYRNPQSRACSGIWLSGRAVFRSRFAAFSFVAASHITQRARWIQRVFIVMNRP